MGRPLLPGEVVHHEGGNHRNNHPDNLMVLSSQRHHASVEFHVRRTRQGMPSLFPEVLISTVNKRREGLFAHLGLPALRPLSRKR